ncbi:hypothetical protein F5X96DRAFT_695670 [Biscogniauxia mediterranea]|nr:hypothetical protein F5X96DRAFT_695670 [Biscogniauxia mediterranea]
MDRRVGYVDRVRYERRNELAKIARDRHADISFILGLSWRVKSWQAHFDYVGGIDTAKIRRGLASLKDLELSLPKITQVPVQENIRSPPLPSLRDALVQAAPVDFQQRHSRWTTGLGGKGVTKAKQQQQRVRLETERKRRDFAGILSQIDTEAIARLALNILQSQQQRQRRRLTVLRQHRPRPRPLPLPQISEPFFGSAHVFYAIRFHEDEHHRRGPITWIIKIPAAGTPDTWDRLCAETLRTEALLLNTLKTETSVPVPEVIDADCSPHNDVHVPYLIMEYVRGRRLEDVWFDLAAAGGDEAALADRRAQILENVARAVLPLRRYEFDRGGAPVFDGEGNLAPDAVGPLRELDVQAMIDAWFADGEEGGERTPAYRGVGPWDDPHDAYTAMLDAYPPVSEAGEGVDRLLRLLVGYVQEPAAGADSPASSSSSSPTSSSGGAGSSGGGGGGKRKSKNKNQGEKRRRRFVLAHPDLSMRNIILADDDLSVRAILGWDGARAAPRSLGPEALPRWLTRDFNPYVWRWRPGRPTLGLGGKAGSEEEEEDEDEDDEESNRFEDPPWTLRELRKKYVDIVEKIKAEQEEEEKDGEEGEGDGGGGRGDREEGEINVTRQSLLALTLDVAARDPRCRAAALRRVLDKVSRGPSASPLEDFDFDELVGMLSDSNRQLNGYRLKCLGRNIRELVVKGFVRGAVVW